MTLYSFHVLGIGESVDPALLEFDYEEEAQLFAQVFLARLIPRCPQAVSLRLDIDRLSCGAATKRLGRWEWGFGQGFRWLGDALLAAKRLQ